MARFRIFAFMITEVRRNPAVA